MRSTDILQYGGLAGGWGNVGRSNKLGKTYDKSKLCSVYCDATIALPIIVSVLKERL